MNRIRTQEQQGKSRYEGKSFSFDVGACKQSELILKYSIFIELCARMT